MKKRLPISLIDRNPDQPRKDFDDAYIAELAQSILERGLIQSPTVRPKNNRYQIAAGECRWRAHKLLVEQGHKRFSTMECEVRKLTDAEVRAIAIIENVQRKDMNPIEEAMGYQTLLDDGWTIERIVRELGKGEQKVRARLNLLKLEPNVQTLVRGGQISPAMGSAITWAPAHMQTALVRKITTGKLRTVEQVRHAAIAARDAHAQCELIEMPKPSKGDLAQVSALEAKIDAISALVQQGFKDGECVAAKKVAPDRVKVAADKLALIRKHIQQMEHDLRCAASQGEMLRGTA